MKFSDPESNIAQMKIAEGMHVADFGCGVGFYSLALAQIVGKHGKIYAVDIQPLHLSKLKAEAAHRSLKNIEIIHGDLESPSGSGLLAASADRIIVSNVLFQVDDIFLIAEEVKRVLKPSGLAAVIDWAESSNRISSQANPSVQIGPHKDKIVKHDHVRKVFEATGFELVSRLDSGTHHYGFLFKLPHVTI